MIQSFGMLSLSRPFEQASSILNSEAGVQSMIKPIPIPRRNLHGEYLRYLKVPYDIQVGLIVRPPHTLNPFMMSRSEKKREISEAWQRFFSRLLSTELRILTDIMRWPNAL